MTSKEFVAALREEVVEDNAATFRQLFAETSIDEATDPYWQRALALYALLGDDQRMVFFEVMRQMLVDATSNLLAILDGVGSLPGVKGKLTLMCDGEKLSGDLQDDFLALEEEAS